MSTAAEKNTKRELSRREVRQTARKPTVGLSPWRMAFNRLMRHRLTVVAFAVIAIYIVTAIVTSFNVGGIHDRAATFDLDNRYIPMFQSFEHVFGTDNFGRDVLSRAILGARIALFLGFVSGAIMIPVGIVVGSLAGYYGGWLDDAALYVMSVIVAIPAILLIITIVQILGKSFFIIALAFAITGWVGLARVFRGSFIQAREFEYVLAAQTMGASDLRIIFRHIIPNVFHFAIVRFVLNFVGVIKSEVVLAYLGLTIVGMATWGNMIDISKQEVAAGHWQNLVSPTIFMFLFLACLNIFGDALRDALDPKLRNI